MTASSLAPLNIRHSGSSSPKLFSCAPTFLQTYRSALHLRHCNARSERTKVLLLRCFRQDFHERAKSQKVERLTMGDPPCYLSCSLAEVVLHLRLWALVNFRHKAMTACFTEASLRTYRLISLAKPSPTQWRQHKAATKLFPLIPFRWQILNAFQTL